MDTQRSVEVDCGASPEELAKFAGFYECDEGGKVDLYMDGDILKLRMEDLEFEVKASDHRTLFYDDMGQQRVLRFYFREEASKPWAVLAGSRMLRRKQ